MADVLELLQYAHELQVLAPFLALWAVYELRGVKTDIRELNIALIVRAQPGGDAGAVGEHTGLHALEGSR